ncbi:MAG: hypothetical protein MZV63_61020 [Marinilabiliales bacterium]|nr:hypothetical protein [Marinilabiliales bacterium]
MAELGMPEDFDPGFYTKFMDHVFVYSLPGFIQPLVLADRGIALIDPAESTCKGRIQTCRAGGYARLICKQKRKAIY